MEITHGGEVYVTVPYTICPECDLEKVCAGYECPKGFMFKLKEPGMSKVKLSEIEFKVITGTGNRAAKLAEAMKQAGCNLSVDSGYKYVLYNGLSNYLTETNFVVLFESWDNPFMTLPQVLELLARVEKPEEAVFDIEPFERVLVRASFACVWNCAIFNRPGACINLFFMADGNPADGNTHVVKYEGNEKLLGMCSTNPDSWWECFEGKPVLKRAE